MQNATIIKKLEQLRIYYQEGKIPVLHQHEVNPGLDKGSRENYLYFIMTCSLNFQRLSPNTWASALATRNDPDTRFVFYPEQVVIHSTEDLRIALLKYKLALQPNKHIQIRETLCHTWHDYFDNDPRELFKRYDYDVAHLLQCIQYDMKQQFPYLSGRKLSNYFLFILLEYSDLSLKNSNEISIIPDTHIMKATKVLGLTEKEHITREETESLRKSLLSQTPYSPIQFHSLLRNRSRNNFIPSI